MTVDEERIWRRELLAQMRGMHATALRRLQEQAAEEMKRTSEQTNSRYWAAHKLINVISYRSFGRMDVPCRHR